MRRVMRSAAMALAFIPVAVRAAEPPCLTPAEFTALSSYAMPSMITGTAQRCSASLPDGAYLRRSGAALAGRYATLKESNWPGAKASFLKLSSGINDPAADLIRNLPDTSLRPMVDALIEGLISQQIPAERCRILDRLIELLSPLPPHSTAEIVGLAVGLGSKTDRGRVGKITICSS